MNRRSALDAAEDYLTKATLGMNSEKRVLLSSLEVIREELNMAYNGEPWAVFLVHCISSRPIGIPWEVGRSKDKIVNSINLTKRQKAILVGTLLGDGSLQKTGSKNARLRLEHGQKQKEYLIWKGEQFPKLFSTKPEFIERIHPANVKSGKTYGYWRWQSNASPVLGKWRQIFYRNSKKEIPENIRELLILPLALAVWYMDDGFYDLKQKHSFIYLGRTKRSEAELAAEAILKNFQINPRIYDKKEKGFALFFPVAETKKLHSLIGEHIIPIMNYKIFLTP